MKNLTIVFFGMFFIFILPLQADTMLPFSLSLEQHHLLSFLPLLLALVLLAIVLLLEKGIRRWSAEFKNRSRFKDKSQLKSMTHAFDKKQLERAFSIWKKMGRTAKLILVFAGIAALNLSELAHAQGPVALKPGPLWKQGGIIITVVLVMIPIIVGLVLMVVKVRKLINKHSQGWGNKDAEVLAAYLETLTEAEQQELMEKKERLDYTLSNDELGGKQQVRDERGLLAFQELTQLPVVPIKKKALPRPDVDPKLARLIKWYLISATFWLLFGTTVGEYLGVKFLAPDLDSVSWLSFGRLRPVHTNAVFWGWASLGMLGLGYYIVPRVSNAPLARIAWGWWALCLINASVFLGSISLMMGINNGGGEYREYIWPIMLLFGLGVGLSIGSYYKTIAQRKTGEIYISNWYILSAAIFISVTAIVGYIPTWQDGLGETIVQGYYMHQAVGMWFMLFTLGIVYYFLPQQLNRPIYSYSLGIMAFWTQILFYTLIGTHHFVFSAIPWWLQTVAIVASVGMVIPVVAGTTNFLLTFKGAWYKIKDSYTLPFFLVGIIFYFTGSLQGTAEAFRYTNLLWHFTDFTVAHSHMTMYGIITFLLWGGIYALLPRLSGQEAPQSTVGAHFWLALIGLLFYSIPLMYGGTMRGLAWMDNVPFVETITMMMPYWLWRAIGGSLMWASHLFFAYNMYKMLQKPSGQVDTTHIALKKLEDKFNTSN